MSVLFKPLLRMKQILILILFFYAVTTEAKSRWFIAQPNILRSEKEAILVLPGFGSKMHGTKNIADAFFNKETDVFIPDYISRKSVDGCVSNLNDFILKHKLNEYKSVHVFSYIVGSWTLNKWIKENPLNNIKSIVYDRSPWQERAPFALVEDIPFLIRIISGPIMKEFSETKYSSVNDNTLKIGILIVNKATKLVYKHKKAAEKPGPVFWDVDSLHQNFDDYMYIYMNHDELYTVIENITDEILCFFKHGFFSETARRQKYEEDPFTEFTK